METWRRQFLAGYCPGLGRDIKTYISRLDPRVKGLLEEREGIMFKKLLIAVGALIAVVLIVVIAAGVVVYLMVDKGFIETRMAEALDRQVAIEKLDVGIFSAVTGIEMTGLAVSNFKSPGDLARLQGQPVDPADLFVGA